MNFYQVNASTYKKCVLNVWQLFKELFIIRSTAQKEVLNRIRYGFNLFCDRHGIVKQDGNVLWFQLLRSLDAAVLSGIRVTSFSCIWKEQLLFMQILAWHNMTENVTGVKGATLAVLLQCHKKMWHNLVSNKKPNQSLHPKELSLLSCKC